MANWRAWLSNGQVSTVVANAAGESVGNKISLPAYVHTSTAYCMDIKYADTNIIALRHGTTAASPCTALLLPSPGPVQVEVIATYSLNSLPALRIVTRPDLQNTQDHRDGALRTCHRFRTRFPVSKYVAVWTLLHRQNPGTFISMIDRTAVELYLHTVEY